MMQLDTALAVAGITGLFGLIILIVLWPGEKQGVRLLAKWGVRNPTADQVPVAVRYLRRRRFWYPWLFLGLPLIPGTTNLVGERNANSLVFVVLLGGLAAEILAQRPSREPRREAVLAPRGVLDFAPLWTIIVSGLATLAAVVHLAVLRQWGLLAVTVGAAAVSWIIVLLAVRRPAMRRPGSRPGTARAQRARRPRARHRNGCHARLDGRRPHLVPRVRGHRRRVPRDRRPAAEAARDNHGSTVNAAASSGRRRKRSSALASGARPDSPRDHDRLPRPGRPPAADPSAFEGPRARLRHRRPRVPRARVHAAGSPPHEHAEPS